MHSSIKPPTIAEQWRMRIIQADVGCIACRLEGTGYNPPDIHHLLSGGTRRGHRYTIGLCAWHHRGVVDGPYNEADLESVLGPSLAINSRKFHARYGSDEFLLEETDKRCAAVDSTCQQHFGPEAEQEKYYV